MSVLQKFYQTAMSLLSPFIRAVLHIRAWRGKEDPDRLCERWGLSTVQKVPGQSVVWIHAISVGEANSALILVLLVQKLYPEAQILLTTGTVTSANLMAKKLPQGVIHQYIPVDIPLAINKFLDFWRPQLAMWVESELWPNMLFEIQQRNLTLLLFNGRMSEKSFLRWQKFAPLITPLLKGFSWCGVQTLQQKEFFERLGAPSVEVMTNLKLLSDPPVFSDNHLESLRASLQNRPVWLASCTHPGEEEKILKVHQKLLQTQKNALLFLSPRHIKRSADIKAMLGNIGFSYSLRSEKETPLESDQVYVVDTMGELGLFYSLAPMTFMGGTWAPKGGHNPIEAAQLGSYVFHGPHIASNEPLYRLLEDLGACQSVASEDDLYRHISEGVVSSNQNWQALKAEGLSKVTETLKFYLARHKDVG